MSSPRYLSCGSALAACGGKPPATATKPPVARRPQPPRPPAIPSNPLKEAYFGETHLHTAYSLDAYLGGTRLTPGDAYRFARGEEMEVNGEKVKIDRPLDFAAVTDHAEYLGEMYSTMVEGAPGHDQELLKELRTMTGFEEREAWFAKYVVANNRGSTPQHAPFFAGPETVKSAWKVILEAAEKYNEPGVFTTIPAFEWSAAPKGGNLHRNVFFRDTNVPDMPMSYVDINREEGLWQWMAGLEEKGMKVFAVPHNSNASKKMMFAPDDSSGKPLDRDYATLRARFEPLIEMMQIKGNSEVHRKFWAADEFAGFENADSLADYSGRTMERENFVRYGLVKGLAYEKSLGVNPWKYGVVGGTDNHNGTPANVAEDNWAIGSHGGADGTVERRRTGEVGGWAKARDLNPGSIAGVWAPENTRAAIWDAMKAKETFATSGPRIKVQVVRRVRPAGPAEGRRRSRPPGLRQGRAHGRHAHAAGRGRQAPLHRLGQQGCHRRQPGPDPDHQGLGRARWFAPGEDHQRGLVRQSHAEGRRVAGCRWRYRGPEDGDLLQRHRQPRADGHVDRRLVRPGPGRGLLRPRPADPDAALDHLRRGARRSPAARRRARDGHRARLDLAHLVHPLTNRGQTPVCTLTEQGDCTP